MKTRVTVLASKFFKAFGENPTRALVRASRYLAKSFAKKVITSVSRAQQPIAEVANGELPPRVAMRAFLFDQSVIQNKSERATNADYASSQLSLVQSEIERDLIQEFGTDNNYTKAYRAQEIFYWYPVLSWIEELSGLKSIADIGTAYGTLLVYAARKHHAADLVAIDPCNYMARSTIKRFAIAKVTADIERQDIDLQKQYDLVIFTEVLEHLNFYPVSTLKKLRAMMSDDGFLILTTPDAEEWGRVLDFYPSLQSIPVFNGQNSAWFDGHIWQYTHEEAVSVMEAAGLRIVDWAYSKGVAARHLCYLLKRA